MFQPPLFEAKEIRLKEIRNFPDYNLIHDCQKVFGKKYVKWCKEYEFCWVNLQ